MRVKLCLRRFLQDLKKQVCVSKWVAEEPQISEDRIYGNKLNSVKPLVLFSFSSFSSVKSKVREIHQMSRDLLRRAFGARNSHRNRPRRSQSLVDEHQHCINVISPHIETEFTTNTAFSSTCVNRVNQFRRVASSTRTCAATSQPFTGFFLDKNTQNE